jgi:hypothetical protein
MKKSKFLISAGTACILAALLAGCQTHINSDKVGALDVVPDRVSMAQGTQGNAAAAAVAKAVAQNSGFPLDTQHINGSLYEFRGVYARVAAPDRVIVTYGHGVFNRTSSEPLTAEFLTSQRQTSTIFDVTVSPAGDKVSISPDAQVSHLSGPDLPTVAPVDMLARDLRRTLSSMN